MAKQKRTQEVQARIKELQDKKAAELEIVHQKQTEAQTQMEAADLAIKDATERMDLDAYEKAKATKRKAQTALDMYGGKYNQIKQQEYISETESDKVIDSLLEYENQLAEDFRAAAGVQLKKLADLLKDYKKEVQDVESTLDSWQRNIHANYNTRGNSIFYDEITGQHTNRSPHPVAVHTMPYTGCEEATQLEQYLKKAKDVYEG